MADKTAYVYLRLSDGARHSQIDLAATVIEDMLGTVTLEKDGRDNTVYCFALPPDIDATQGKQLISTLVTRSYIDEVWMNEGVISQCSPQFHLK